MTAHNLGQEWMARPERSITASIRFIVWSALHLGRLASRLMLYPICFYFLIFSVRPRAASRQYLAKVLARRPRWVDLFRHYYAFAACLLDRVFLLSDRRDVFDIRIHGEEMLLALAARGEGCLLFGAHLGSFEIMRAMCRTRTDLRVRIAMYEENSRKINSVLNSINPGLAIDIISLGTLDSMLNVQESLDRGELVGMLVDRNLEGKGHHLRCDFLGEPAPFPLGPFRIAAAVRRPIVMMVGLYRGGRRYDIHFELLTDFTGMPRAARAEAVDAALRGYVTRLEHFCRIAPYNWFNFYDFWT